MSEPPESTASKLTPFGQRVSAALSAALAALRTEGIIEVEDANVEKLTAEVVEAVLESTSEKKIPLRITKTLIRSEHVEEVYGTDSEISEALRPYLSSI